MNLKPKCTEDILKNETEHIFTYLKPKSTEDMFKDKTDLEIKDIFVNESYTYHLRACIKELIKRNSINIIQELCLEWPRTMTSILKEFKKSIELSEYHKIIVKLQKYQTKHLLYH